MNDDPRCCGSGTCIIDDQGLCWCGQQWNGHTMCHAPLALEAGPDMLRRPGLEPRLQPAHPPEFQPEVRSGSRPD
jgi:hypothetical protein